MRIKAIGLGLVLAAAAMAGAQGFAVLLSNPETADFHFVLDPPELASFDPGSSVFASVLDDYFRESPSSGRTAFLGLAAGATLRLKDLAEGYHLLVGFFTSPGRRDYPVRALRLKAGGGQAERPYSVYQEPSLLKARAGRGRLAGFPAQAAGVAATSAATAPLDSSAPAGELGIRIDNDFADWEIVPVFRNFSDYRPRTFTREQLGGQRRELPLEQSRFWQIGGTGLAELKIVDNGGSLYLFLSARSAMGEGLSFYLYFRDPRDAAGENRVTVELLPAMGDKAGLAALWVKDREPVSAGSLASGVFFLEAALDKSLILKALDCGETPSLELTSGYHDRGSLAYEEFYYEKLELWGLPTPGTLFEAKGR